MNIICIKSQKVGNYTSNDFYFYSKVVLNVVHIIIHKPFWLSLLD